MASSNLTRYVAEIHSHCTAHIQSAYFSFVELPEIPAEAGVWTADNDPLTLLCRRLQLSDVERQLLLLCLAVEVDKNFIQLFAEVVTGQDITLNTAKALTGHDATEALAPTANLRRWKLIEVYMQGLLHSPLRLPERVLHYLAGNQTIAASLAGWLEPVTIQPVLLKSVEQAAIAIERQWASDATSPAKAVSTVAVSTAAVSIVQLIGRDLLQIQEVAAAVAAKVESKLYQANLIDLPAEPEKMQEWQQLLDRELLFGDFILLLDCRFLHDQQLAEQKRQQLINFINRLIQHWSMKILLWVNQPVMQLSRPVQLVNIAELSKQEQLELWQKQLDGTFSSQVLGALVEQFCLNRLQIAGVSREWQQLPQQEATQRQLWLLCRQQLRQHQADKTRLIEAKASWEDLILSSQQQHLLQQLISQVQHRFTVFNEWGFAGKSGRGLGIIALFEGDSGTGKTMAAEVIAHELDLDLMIIDLSNVISKYVGETEKNLDQVFASAENSGAVLLFDEADALFAKRTDVKDSRDKYANQEVSYLLQRLEAYRGLSILTSNLKHSIDGAFLRRFRTIIHFSYPAAEQRTRIWQTVLPAKLPTEPLDFTELGSYQLSGGEIRMAAMSAAFKAAQAQQAMNMQHLHEAILEEFAKNEKPVKKS